MAISLGKKREPGRRAAKAAEASERSSSVDQLRSTLRGSPRLTLALCAALLLLGVWLCWNSVAQIRHRGMLSDMEGARNNGGQLVQQALRQHFKRLQDGLAAPGVSDALRAGDMALAAKLAGSQWPNLESLEILPPDLKDTYAALSKGGYGRVAAIEEAMAEHRETHLVTQGLGGPRLALAAPVRVDDRVVGVASAVLPLRELTSGLDSAAQVSGTYLALRQGGVTVWQRGDQAYAESAERSSQALGDSPLRMVTAGPEAPRPVFGLGVVPALAVGLGCFLLAYVLWRMSHKRPAEAGGGQLTPTLGEMAAEPPGEGEQKAFAIREPIKAVPVMIDRGIFRAYDIRGVVGQSLDAGIAELIGHAVGSLMHEQGLREIVIGRDGRLSGPTLVEGLITGLMRAGCDVIDVGMVPTPVIYFGAYHLRTGCCISVTGSHNPPDYNGFKIVVGGETLSGDAIVDLHTRIAEDRLYTAGERGTVSVRDIGIDYVQRIASDVQLGRPLRVVVDAGNGVAGELGPRVLEAIGAEVEELFCDIDGTFPNHHPDPSEPHNLVDLIEMVKRRDADIGIAFDGDGDRLGVVTRDGENIFADRLLMLFAADVLERNPGAMIVYDVKCTGRLPGYILRHGGSPLMWKTGHSLIKAKMRETGAELAGEMSGHFFFAERWYGFDDGIYAAARLLEILAAAPEEPDEVLKALPKGVSTPEIKVEAPGGDPHAFVERFCQTAQFEGGRASTIDGLRVDWPDGWGLVRASNTTPVLVLRFDADTDRALARIQGEFRTRLLAIKPDLQLPF